MLRYSIFYKSAQFLLTMTWMGEKMLISIGCSLNKKSWTNSIRHTYPRFFYNNPIQREYVHMVSSVVNFPLLTRTGCFKYFYRINTLMSSIFYSWHWTNLVIMHLNCDEDNLCIVNILTKKRQNYCMENPKYLVTTLLITLIICIKYSV